MVTLAVFTHSGRNNDMDKKHPLTEISIALQHMRWPPATLRRFASLLGLEIEEKFLSLAMRTPWPEVKVSASPVATDNLTRALSALGYVLEDGVFGVRLVSHARIEPFEGKTNAVVGLLADVLPDAHARLTIHDPAGDRTGCSASVLFNTGTAFLLLDDPDAQADELVGLLYANATTKLQVLRSRLAPIANLPAGVAVDVLTSTDGYRMAANTSIDDILRLVTGG